MSASLRVRIRLEWAEIMLAVSAGTMRRIFALKNGKCGVYGASDEAAWDNDINGAIAELACAKWANVFWNGTVGITTLPDVGKWQIRSKVIDGHRLVVRPTDADRQIFISALVQLPIVSLCGWLFGADAKNAHWLKEYPPKPPMYFVEDQYLQPMETLRFPCKEAAE
jgi:hypothetical protein